MGIRMPGPVLIGTSRMFHLNVRVPRDLEPSLRGSRVTLPVADDFVDAKIGDKVIVSLKTPDVKLARTRFTPAYAALQAHFEAFRAGPKPLSHKQIVALAGDSYRGMVGEGREDDPPDFETAFAEHAAAFADFKYGPGGVRDEFDDADDPIDAGGVLSDDQANLLAAIQLPRGPQLMTWRHGADLNMPPYFSMSLRQALEDLFGREADEVCAKHGLRLDDERRLKLLKQIGRATRLGTKRLEQTFAGDFSRDVALDTFPTFDPEPVVTVVMLFERWKTHKSDKIEPSTIRRYTPSLNSLAAFLKTKDVRAIGEDDIWAWAEHRRDVDGIAARTINRNDLVAASSVFDFATRRDGKRLRKDNPVNGVKLEEPKLRKTREKCFRQGEIRDILVVTRGVTIGRAYPKADASRRWVPWICAYSGCRVQEPLWLERSDVWRDAETGIWVMRLPKTKSGNARIVPLHDVLIEEGFLAFVESSLGGLLFVGDRARKVERDDRTIQEQRASAITEWIGEHVDLDNGVDPSHGWRHTFITRATGKMEKRIQNAICGHNEKEDVSDGYFTATIPEMKAGLDRFPRFKI